MNQELLTHYGRVRLSNLYSDRNAAGLAHFKINTRFINNMRKFVRLQFRSGLEMTVPVVDARSPRANDGEFVIQHELVVDIAGIEQMRSYFATVTDERTLTLQMFRDSFLRQYQESKHQTKPIVCALDYVVTEKDLNDLNGMFYHDALDIAMKLGDAPFTLPHPQSPEGRIATTENEASIWRNRLGFIFSIEIIDSLGKYGDRYISICNQVYKISAKTDNNKPDGIYVISSKPTNGRLTSEMVTTMQYPFEDAEKRLGLYPTYEQAATFGDQAAARKREIAELEHTIQLAKQQALLDKVEADKLIAERDRHLRDLEYERSIHRQQMEDLQARQEHLLEMERQRMRMEYEKRKDDYDKKSTDRKDSSELLRFLPHVLAAIGAILMAYKAFKTG